MSFISLIYTRIKLFFAGTGGLLSTTCIIAGIVLLSKGTIAILLIIGGVVWLFSSGFLFFDGTNVTAEIKKEVDNIRSITDEYKYENTILKQSVTSLNESFAKSQTQVDELEKIKQSYESNIKEYKEILIDEKLNTEKLKQSVNSISESKLQLQLKIQDLNNSINSNNKSLDNLSKLKIEYEQENNKLKENNEENKEKIEAMETQIHKLGSLYNDSKKLISNLVSAGDMFNNFGKEIESNNKQLSETSKHYDKSLMKMDNLILKLKTSTYEELDKNKDGVISKDEFDDFIC